jgi:serine protease inhibitor
MRRKNLMGFTAAMGIVMAGTQLMQAAVPVWAKAVNVEMQSESSSDSSSDADSSESPSETSYDDLVEIPTLSDEEYPIDEMLGAYEPAESPEITDEIQALCDKAFADLEGAVYTPVALIATQVVAGTNYEILFEKEIVVPDAEKTYAIGIIYEDLDGNASITEIDDISDEEAEKMLLQAQAGKTVQTLVDADNRIGSALMEKLAADKENVFLSSYSIATALTLLSHCSEGGDQIEQLKSFLGMEDLTEDEILTAQKALTALLGANKEGSETDEYGYPKSILETANAVYIDDELKTVPSFEDLTNIFSDTYQASLKKCDLSTEDTMNEINAWVNDKTHGLIDSILEEPMSEDVRMALLNAVYFKASWIKEFSEDLTDKQIFHGAKGDTTVDMMHQEDHFDYAENDDYQMIRLPYYGDSEMTVYLPKDTTTADKWSEADYLATLTQGADAQEWDYRKVSLSMPKFELEYGTELADVLEELGVERIFNDNVYDRLSDEELFVGSVYHKTAIKNDEKGTEAAAVTMIEVAETGLLPDEEVVEMNMDHPFYFTISNTDTGLKLFEGCIYNLD